MKQICLQELSLQAVSFLKVNLKSLWSLSKNLSLRGVGVRKEGGEGGREGGKEGGKEGGNKEGRGEGEETSYNSNTVKATDLERNLIFTWSNLFICAKAHGVRMNFPQLLNCLLPRLNSSYNLKIRRNLATQIK